METADYRIESTGTVLFRLIPGSAGIDHLFRDRAMAVAMAAKGITDPPGDEIRVVHVPTGKVVFCMPGLTIDKDT